MYVFSLFNYILLRVLNAGNFPGTLLLHANRVRICIRRPCPWGSIILADLTLLSNRPLRVLHAILTTRVILNVRIAVEKPVTDFDKSCFGDIPTFVVHSSVGSDDHHPSWSIGSGDD